MVFPTGSLELDLDLSEMDLKDMLNILDSKGIVSYHDGNVTILETDMYKCWWNHGRCQTGRIKPKRRKGIRNYQKSKWRIRINFEKHG